MPYFGPYLAHMSEDELYPVYSSTYTGWDDGKTYTVPCTIPGAAVEVDLSYDCPDGFVRPRDESDSRNCIQVIAQQSLFLKYVALPSGFLSGFDPVSFHRSYLALPS
jgi:hypothetical protein